MTRKRYARLTLLSIALTLLICSQIFAGGPNVLTGAGTYYKWPDGPVPFTIDVGRLGSLLDADAAQQLIRDAAQEWNDVESSTLLLQDNGLLSEDITVDNYRTFFGLDLPFNQRAACCLRPENPIVFDTDGSITDDLLGVGSSFGVIGFAGARFVDPATLSIQSGWAVMNGRLASPVGTFPAAVTHEFGHMLGLDHTQGIKENFTEQRFRSKVPLMYPIAAPGGAGGPIRDDIAWFSWLYPQSDFASQTGTITGRVSRRSGAPLLGANVVAVKVEEGEASRDEAVAVVSDYLGVGTGEFEIPGLLPGDYYVYIEPILDEFTGGSGVGPYDVRFTGFIRDYYDANESSTENPNEKLMITVNAGQTVAGVNLIANEEINNLSALQDDDEMLYVFPDGFTFPFFGESYSQVVVNSDGNLTFGVGDSDSTERDEERFLSGPPRIAPLFTDLDPGNQGGAGDVKAIETEGSIRFLWDGVPEFDAFAFPDPNTFSVTLFSNGDILFDYGDTAITPDDAIQAIVGITPGGGQPGVSQDLSTGNATYQLNGSVFFQTFLGQSLDLDGSKILFQSNGNPFYVPIYSGGNLGGQFPDLQQFTGFAVTNVGDQDTDLIMEARGPGGVLLGFPTNPGVESVAANTQIAKLGSQVLGAEFSDEQAGWIRLRSSHLDLASFFMIGNGLSPPGSQTRLDGSIAVSQQAQALYFTRLYEGNAAFPSNSGGRPARTFISVANPNTVQISVTFKQYAPAGGNPLRQATHSIEPLGVLTETLQEIFSTQDSFTDGFVLAEVTGPGAVGFELLEVGDTLMGLNAITDTSASESYSAQLAYDPNSIFTSLKLVNTTSVAKTVTLTAFLIQGDGSIDSVSEEQLLNPRQSLQLPVEDIFDLDGSGGIVEGSLRVECPGGGVIGDVIFGDPATVRYAAALALQSKPFRKAVFSQVSNALDAFTGLAFLNPNAAAAVIQIEVYDGSGQLVGSGTVNLGSWERISELLEQRVSEAADLVGGYIVITSDQPIVAQELFGNFSLAYLAAVPPEFLE